MNRLFFILFLFSICFTSKAQKGIFSDTVWTSHLNDADLILKVKVTERWYITDGGIFSCKVLAVVKGKYGMKEASFSMGMIESNRQKWDARYNAIWKEPINTVIYLGFKKTDGGYGELEDKKLKNKWEFFMSGIKPEE